jgi:hypothetical protein
MWHQSGDGGKTGIKKEDGARRKGLSEKMLCAGRGVGVLLLNELKRTIDEFRGIQICQSRIQRRGIKSGTWRNKNAL